MTKFQKIGIAILVAIGFIWIVRGCAARSRPGYKLAKQLQARNLGISSIEINETRSWFEDIDVSGRHLRFKIILMANDTMYKQYEKMFEEAADKVGGKAPTLLKIEGKPTTIIMSRPFIIWIAEEPERGALKAALEAELGKVRAFDFSKAH